MSTRHFIGMCAMATLLFASPTLAQKSADTLRIPLFSQLPLIDPYLYPVLNLQTVVDAIFDTLTKYDEEKRRYEPLLAKSWRRIDDTTLEFVLREDVVWHDGSPFSADDVVYTINWLIDPKTRLRYKHTWEWIARVEKVNGNTIRIVAKRQTPFDLMVLSYDVPIFPKHIHSALDDKNEFGRRPLGTGAYVLSGMFTNQDISLVKNNKYKHGGTVKPENNIKNIKILSLSDTSVAMAKMRVGELDIIASTSLLVDQALALKDAGFIISIRENFAIRYLAFDVRGRSGFAPLLDIRVRRALVHAINREELATLQAAGLPAGEAPKGLCRIFQAGCGFSERLPVYDPSKARDLLAEAGYADGFDLKITTPPAMRSFVEAVAGQLRKVGIRATVDINAIPVLLKKRQEGSVAALANIVLGSDRPDVYGTLGDSTFTPGNFDMFGDSRVHELIAKSNVEVNDSVRRKITQEVFDRVVRGAYMVPLYFGYHPVAYTGELELRASSGGSLLPLHNLNWVN
ncbi:MAG TPA: ABC transporter substrate-binding protein [Candidatus Paceibacterota bacterium]